MVCGQIRQACRQLAEYLHVFDVAECHSIQYMSQVTLLPGQIDTKLECCTLQWVSAFKGFHIHRLYRLFSSTYSYQLFSQL